MKNKEKKEKKDTLLAHEIGEDFFGQLWNESWIYIKTVVDVVHEPVLILDKNLCVMAANDSFYRTFQVDKKDTEGRSLYKLGNTQWNIPALRKLLEKILPNDTFFKGFEVSHDFPSIGHKIMLLNARQIYYQKDSRLKHFPPIILLAIEDVTEIMAIAESFTKRIQEFEAEYLERTEKLEKQVVKLEEAVQKISISS